jgi:hypothetical protein
VHQGEFFVSVSANVNAFHLFLGVHAVVYVLVCVGSPTILSMECRCAPSQTHMHSHIGMNADNGNGVCVQITKDQIVCGRALCGHIP